MSRGLVLEFTKMHGAGNDFIVIDNRFFRFSDSELSDLASGLCPRRVAIGADGLLALDVDSNQDLDFRMRYFNADGSPGEMCGNGARCLAAFARASGLDTQPLVFGTDAGIYRAFAPSVASRTSDGPDSVRLIMPMPTEVSLDFASIDTGPGGSFGVDFVMAGVPHAVCFTKSIEDIAVEPSGAAIRADSSFTSTNGTNVDFVEIRTEEIDPILHVRTFERGVEAETLACGTGAISAFIVASRKQLLPGNEALVNMRGGQLRVGFESGSDELFLEGPVAFSYRGTVVL